MQPENAARPVDHPFDDEDGTLAGLFELLSSEPRLRIISVLAAHEHTQPEAGALGFEALRERVGIADSGQFNYHLSKLEGSLVKQVDGGYGLTRTGRRVVTIVSQVPLGGPAETPDDD